MIVSSRSPDLPAAMAKAARALAEFRLAGCDNNLTLLSALLERPEVAGGGATTTFVEAHMVELAARAAELADAAPRREAQSPSGRTQIPLSPPPPDAIAAIAPLRGTVVSLEVGVGQMVRQGETVAVLEAMKMQHLVAAPAAGEILRIEVVAGQTVDLAAALLFIAPGEQADAATETQAVDLDLIRPDLAEVLARHVLTQDQSRPAAVARRRRTGQRTARENLDDLFDEGSFKEFGALALAAQRRRRDLDDLKANTPADGLVVGVGEVNGSLFDEDRARCVALAYDFTVLAGTQGHFNHKKTDRILEFAEHWKAPIVWFTEGGGGRPGDVDVAQLSASSLDTSSFTTFARLSGTAPRIAINSGRCFAGNAVFFGCADITIATRYSNIGLGGPAMIEGGGLGVFTPDEIGPSDVLYANGALDLLVEDEAAATDAARRLLGDVRARCPSGPARTSGSCATSSPRTGCAPTTCERW